MKIKKRMKKNTLRGGDILGQFVHSRIAQRCDVFRGKLWLNISSEICCDEIDIMETSTFTPRQSQRLGNNIPPSLAITNLRVHESQKLKGTGVGSTMGSKIKAPSS